MTTIDQRETFLTHCRLLAVLLEVLVILALLSGAFPVALANPVWFLRLADGAVGLAPVLLLAVILLHLGSVLVSQNSVQGLSSGHRSLRLAGRWALVFAVLVPLQLLAFGWLWLESAQQLQARFAQVENQRSALLSSLMASSSEAELRQRITQVPPDGFPAPPLSLLQAPAPLAIQKQRLNDASLGALTTIKANLDRERQSMLRNSLPGALRGLIGAGLISAFLFTVTRAL
jgi:hypothetical protein